MRNRESKREQRWRGLERIGGFEAGRKKRVGDLRTV